MSKHHKAALGHHLSRKLAAHSHVAHPGTLHHTPEHAGATEALVAHLHGHLLELREHAHDAHARAHIDAFSKALHDHFAA